MIVYKSSDWWDAFRHLHKSSVIRKLLKRVVLVGLYGTVVALLGRGVMNLKFTVDPQYFSLLGILLSLLLAFRTNTAYDRFWEGRRQWGQLINSCRNLAVLLHARLPASDRENRFHLAKLLSNFPMALDGHLRGGVRFEKLEDLGPELMEQLSQASHVPSLLSATLQEYYEQLLRQELILPIHLLAIQRHHEVLLDVTGACERIQRTPIPFSYSFFIKAFISVFLMVMPLVLLTAYGYFMVPITMFGAFALLGVEMIGDEIEDPFGKDSNDLPLTQMSNRIRVNVHEILGVELNEEKKALAAAPYSVVF
ncbi:bestrophin family protein [Hymenobacter koreensis]|uniref:Bestrophin family ion channel n=1 Tax=Hymenobacter koreensis TaxID=1084523 RepID=A0ABP8ITN2_9BACT